MFIEILHSAKPTGAPRVGLEVALWLKEYFDDILLISQEDGPIVNLAQDGGLRTRIAEEPLSKVPFRERVAACSKVLENLNCTVAYVNSIEASAWAVAAKMLGAKVVLHVHELEQSLKVLLRLGLTCHDICASADAVVVAANAAVGGLSRTLGYVPSDVVNIGVFTDPEVVRHKALQTVLPQWQFGRRFAKSSRKIIGMCGTACHRKGLDYFIRLAQRLQQFDFLWIGEWTDDARQTARSAGFENAFPENFYLTGHVDNPYPLMLMFDLFVLTSREDPNPIVALEAMALGKPVVCFTQTGDTWRIGGDGLYAIHGKPNEDLLCATITKLMGEPMLRATVLPARLTRMAVLSRLSEELGRRGLIPQREALSHAV